MPATFSEQTYTDCAHLLRRASFGGSPVDISAAATQGVAATTDSLLHYDRIPDTIDDDAFIEKMLEVMPERLRGGNLQVPVQAIKVWWTYRMLMTQRPLEEKMVLFWHNHFTSSDQDGVFMIKQNQLYRRNALGDFRTLAKAASRNPEMLRYLNGNANYKAHPNENYARELMELFTCGRVGPDGSPNYTEDDVKAAARSFSGWNMRGQSFNFDPNQHDDTQKTFMGRTGNFNGDDIVDILVSLPATASYLCRKLFRYFAYYDPEPAVMAALVDTYYQSGYSVRAVVTTILTSQAFWSPKARFALFKSPTEFAIGAVKMAGLSSLITPQLSDMVDDEDVPKQPRYQPSPLARLTNLAIAIRSMGQDLLAPPNVKGWDGGEMWINTNSLQARGKFASTLSYAQMLPDIITGSSPTAQNGDGSLLHNADFMPTLTNTDPKSIVDSILFRMGPLKVSPAVYQSLVDYATSVPGPRQRVSGVFALVLGTPEFQMS